MHTSRTIHTAEFEVTVDGRPGTLDDALPALTTRDRIAVVTRSPGGAIAAAPLLLAAAGRYYENLRAERDDDFYRYPAHFVVHVGEIRGYHGLLDVWPEHREVVVPAHGEAVLEALHDRAVTRVLLEATTPADGELMRENANWFLEDVRDVLVFDPERDLGPLGVRPSAAAVGMVEGTVRASAGVVTEEAAAALVARAAQPRLFAKIPRAEALGWLCGYGVTPDVLGQSPEYLARNGADAAVMKKHHFAVAAPR